MNVKLIPDELYSDPAVRDLLARPDADATFDRVARLCDSELIALLTALAVLRARDATERRLRT